MKLTQMEASLYRANADTLLTCTGDMCVLSVSKDGQEYQHYYLDKTVSISKDIFFSLSVYKDEVTVTLSAEIQPERLGSCASRNIRIDGQLRVVGIYTFFYQEKEQGFLFPGESRPMPEFTYVDQGSLHSVADGQDWLLHQGDAMLYAPDEWHMQYADIGVAPRFVTISFDVEGGGVPSPRTTGAGRAPGGRNAPAADAPGLATLRTPLPRIWSSPSSPCSCWCSCGRP